MLGLAAFVIAAIALAVSVFLARIVLAQGEQIRSLRAQLNQLDARMDELPPPIPAPLFLSPVLESKRVAISITQDHEQPTFAELLKRLLVQEDAAPEIVAGATGENFDLIIRGAIICNGYSDLYYEASLDVLESGEKIVSIVERPVQAGRQINLATTLISRAKQEIESKALRKERQRALKEIAE